MDKENDYISIKQLVTIFLVLVGSPIIRVAPKYVTLYAEKAAWLCPFFSIPVIVVLMLILNKLLIKTGSKSLDVAYAKIIGKSAAKVLNILYILWIMILISLYLRYFGERFTSTIFIFTPVEFFIGVMALLVYFVCQNKIQYFARFSEFFMLILFIIIAFTFIAGVPQINIQNLLPVTTYDILPLALGTLPIISIWGYITVIFFLGESVSNIEDFKKTIKFSSVFLVLSCFITLIITVGIFGCKATESLNMPFFIFYKNIRILTIIERVESILIATWTFIDFVIVTAFTYSLMKLLKRTFSLSSEKETAGPILLIAYVLAQYMASSIFELNQFSIKIFLQVNMFFGVAVPVIIYIIGKIRKKV